MSKSQLQIHRPVLIGDTLECSYSANSEDFTNIYRFPDAAIQTDPVIVRKLCEWIALSSSFGLFSVDYFTELHTDFPLTKEEIGFFEKLAFLGLGEFRVVNGIAVMTRTRIIAPEAPNPSKPTLKKPTATRGLEPLLLNGGGKDGSVSAHLLQCLGVSFTWLQRGSSQAQRNVTAEWNAPVIVIDRKLDTKRTNRRYSGHRPMSANIALLASLVAYRNDYDAVIASNEASANEANLILDGVSINHQYSKSMEFEQDIQQLFRSFGIPVRYFSLLRPLNELQIALIAAQLTDRQLAAITSCNNGTANATWCLACPKCAFVALVLTVADARVPEVIWGRQVINDKTLRPFIGELVDETTQKPFECVGTTYECQLAVRLLLRYRANLVNKSTSRYLSKFITDPTNLVKDTALTKLEPHSMSKDYEDVIKLMDDILKAHKL